MDSGLPFDLAAADCLLAFFCLACSFWCPLAIIDLYECSTCAGNIKLRGSSKRYGDCFSVIRLRAIHVGRKVLSGTRSTDGGAFASIIPRPLLVISDENKLIDNW